MSLQKKYPFSELKAPPDMTKIPYEVNCLNGGLGQPRRVWELGTDTKRTIFSSNIYSDEIYIDFLHTE